MKRNKKPPAAQPMREPRAPQNLSPKHVKRAEINIVLNPNLTRRQNAVLTSASEHILMSGVAGTGKTYTACAKALQWLKTDLVERILIVRSAVEVRSIGFLPGDDAEKAEVYAAPYEPLFRSLLPGIGYKGLMSRDQIDFKLTSHMRGLTFDNTAVIIDEYQNMNAHELDTVVTRAGPGTRLLVCGDSDQSDLHGREAADHVRVIDTLRAMDEFAVADFTIADIVRSPFVKSYYKAKVKAEANAAKPKVYPFPIARKDF